MIARPSPFDRPKKRDYSILWLDPLRFSGLLIHTEIAVSRRKKGAYEDVRNGTESSNPTLSASKSKLQRNCPAFCREIWKTCPYFVIFRPESGLERTDCRGSNGVILSAFLWRGHSQSGFTDSVERMQCDHKPTMRRRRLDLVKHLRGSVLTAALMLRTEAWSPSCRKRRKLRSARQATAAWAER